MFWFRYAGIFLPMDGQMKTVIDRTLPRYTEIRDKEVCFIALQPRQKKRRWRGTNGRPEGFTDCLPGAQVKGVIYGGRCLSER